VLLRVDGRFEVFRPIARRRAQHHDIDVRGDHFLECVEAREAMLGVDIHAGGDGRVRRIFLQVAQRAFEVILEDVAHGRELDVRVGGQRVDRGLRAAPAAADQPGLQLLRAGSADEFRLNERERRGAEAGRRRLFEERSSGRVFHNASCVSIRAPVRAGG
jgi:hypothetical protein